MWIKVVDKKGQKEKISFHNTDDVCTFEDDPNGTCIYFKHGGYSITSTPLSEIMGQVVDTAVGFILNE